MLRVGEGDLTHRDPEIRVEISRDVDAPAMGKNLRCRGGRRGAGFRFVRADHGKREKSGMAGWDKEKPRQRDECCAAGTKLWWKICMTPFGGIARIRFKGFFASGNGGEVSAGWMPAPLSFRKK
jgi:hypothetical protein